jgi:hypothetical protein
MKREAYIQKVSREVAPGEALSLHRMYSHPVFYWLRKESHVKDRALPYVIISAAGLNAVRARIPQ